MVPPHHPYPATPALTCLAFVVACSFFPGTSRAAPPSFQFHYIEKDAAWITSVMQCTLADIDNDGDLDYTLGNVRKSPNLHCYEHVQPDKWVRHVIGSDNEFYGGAVAMDINGDGRTDIISSEYAFINKKGTTTPFAIGWDKHFIGTGDPFCHDMVKVDLNGDGRMDVITNSALPKGEGLCWYEPPADPLQPWIKHDIGDAAYRVHGGTHPWPVGDLDVVQSECDLKDKPAGLGWLENVDGRGTFKLHWIKPRNGLDDFHSLWVFDYDLDGDWDIMVGNGPLSSGKRTFLYENLRGKQGRPTAADWKEHVILEGFVNHEAQVGDVDGDGDLDIVSKEWTSGSVYYLENRLRNPVPKK